MSDDWSNVDRNLKPVRVIGMVYGDAITCMTTTAPPQEHVVGDDCKCDDCLLEREVEKLRARHILCAYAEKG